MKHQHEDYIKFCDEKVKVLDEYIANFEAVSNPKSWNLYPEYVMKKHFRASLLANKATLERHKEVVHYKLPTREQKKAGMDYTDPSLAYSTCSCGFVEHYIAGDGHKSISMGKNAFPCPSLLDVTNQLDEVMG